MIIGDSNIVSSLTSVWTDGIMSSRMRQNERLIFARIDFLMSYLNSPLCDDSDGVENLISVYWLELQLVKEFGNNADLLYKAGAVLSNYVQDILSLKTGGRNSSLLTMLADIKSKTINASIAPADLRFMSEFERDVYSQNYYVDFDSGQKTSSPSYYVGAVSQDMLSEYKKVAGNLVYTQVDYSMMKTPEAKRKYARQTAVLSALSASGCGFTPEICNLGIQSSILQASGWDCETYVSAMQEAGKESSKSVGVGNPAVVVAVIGLVGTFITAGVAIFKEIYEARRVQGRSDAYRALDEASLSYADIPDWWRLGDLDGDGKDDTFKVYGVVAASLIAYYFLGKK